MSTKTDDDLEFEHIEQALRASRQKFEEQLQMLLQKTPKANLSEIEELRDQRKRRETPLRERLWELAKHGVFSPQF